MIIHIQPGDELNTIIHRIQAASQEQITLVVTEDWGLMRDPVVWRTIAQYAQRLDTQILVDTHDLVVSSQARAAGLEVSPADLSAAAEDDALGENQSDKNRRMIERLSVLLLIAAATLGLVYMAMPKVTLVVTPAVVSFQHSLTFPLAGFSAAEAVETEVTITRRTAATGRQVLGISKAVGEVVLINQSEESVTVPRGTIVTTASDTPFLIAADVHVPGVTTQYFMGIPVGMQAGQAAAPIEALVPGSSGNVAEGRIVRIVGFDLDVRNPEPTRGGADTVLQVAAEADLGRARQMVERDADQEVREALARQLAGSGKRLLEETLQVQIAWDGQTPSGEETGEVFATAKVKGKGYSLDEEKLRAEVEAALAKLMSASHVLIPHTIDYRTVAIGGGAGDQFLQCEVAGYSRAVVSPDEVASSVLGAAVDDLETFAERLPAVGHMEVREYSGDHLPRLRRWLNVEIAEPDF